MTYTFSKETKETLSFNDIQTLLMSRFNEISSNIIYPNEVASDEEKLSFLNDVLNFYFLKDDIFIMKITDDDLLVSVSFGTIIDDTFKIHMTIIGKNKQNSMMWAYRDDVSQLRYDFLKSNNISYVDLMIPSVSNIPPSMEYIKSYELISSELQSNVQFNFNKWSFGPLDRYNNKYRLINPGIEL